MNSIGFRQLVLDACDPAGVLGDEEGVLVGRPLIAHPEPDHVSAEPVVRLTQHRESARIDEHVDQSGVLLVRQSPVAQ